MSGDNCDTVSAQSGRLDHAARVGVWRREGCSAGRSAMAHTSSGYALLLEARREVVLAPDGVVATGEHGGPRCGGRVVVCDRSQWLTRAGLASNGRNVALDEPRKSR
jgi:hypothetical protein